MSRVIACALALLAMVGAARAGSAVLRASNAASGSYPVVTLTLNVLGPSGEPTSDVTVREVSLVEMGGSFAPTSLVPHKSRLHVALVIDCSARTKAWWGPIKAAVAEFLGQLDARDRAALVSFGDRARFVEEFTTDKARIKAAMEKLEQAGGTAVADGIAEGVSVLAGEGPRATMVLLTTGPDARLSGAGRQSLVTMRAAVKSARDMQVPIWTMPIGAAAADPLFAKLAAVTGGHAYPAATPDALGPSLARLADALRHQWLLTYRSALPRDSADPRTLTITRTKGDDAATAKVRFHVPPSAPVNDEPATIPVEPEKTGPGFDYSPYQ